MQKRREKYYPDELRKMGAEVDVVNAYVTIMPENRVADISKMLEAGEISMITFTSSSTVTNFMGMFGKNADQVKEWLKDIDIASIGPITSETAKRLGLKVTVEPESYTIDALTEAILKQYS